MSDKKRLDKLLDNYLFEEPEEEEPEEPISNKDQQLSTVDKEKDTKEKDLEDVEKNDLGDEEETPSGDVVASIKLNNNVEGGGQIKLIEKNKISGLTSIENILSMFKIDPENPAKGFKNKIEITINSPLSDFKEHEYTITLMDKIGQLSISRPDFKTTITKKSTGMGGNLGQAVEQGVGEEPEEAAEKPEEQVDLSYLPELDSEFLKAVKNEFFDKILERK